MSSNKPKRISSYIQYSFVPNHTATIEALCRSKLSGRDFRVVLFIMRQTDGYLRNEDQISPGFFEQRTGISKSNISHVLARLIKFKIIVMIGGHPPIYSVTPPDQWDKSLFVKIDEISSSKSTIGHVRFYEPQSQPKENLKITGYKVSIGNKSNDDPDKYIKGRYGHMVRR